MKEIITTNWVSIIIVTVTAGYALYLVVNRKWKQFRSIAYRMILQAEKSITGTKKGQERFEFVFYKLYNLIPGWLQFFVSEESLREKLQEWYDSIKDYMDNGVKDGSNKPPDAPAV